MTPNDMIQTLATELQDVLRNLDETRLRADPDEEFIDLAARLVLQLKKKAITVVPVEKRPDEIARKHGEAAARIFNIFTGWLQTHPTYCVVIDTSTTGKFGVVLRSGMTPLAFFQGEGVQDACAQAAQTIEMNDD